MSYRKFTADYIFTGHELLHQDHVLITDSEGTVVDLVKKYNAGDDIMHFSGILTPGFVNAHCHLELSHLKGIIPENTGLVNFVQQVMSNRTASAEDKTTAMQLAEQELYETGTVAVGDICNTADSISIKQNSDLYWHNFIEVSGFTDALADKRLTDAKKTAVLFSHIPFPCSIVPHAPYSVSRALFQQLNNETAGQLITIHNQECEAENELYKTKSGEFLQLYKNFGIDTTNFIATGNTSLQSWLPYFNKVQSVIFVHNTFMDAKDIEEIQKSKVKGKNAEPTGIRPYYCICINANKYIERKIPPIEMFRRNNGTIVIGTDSYASNRQLNMLNEIRTIQQETASSVPLQEILQWATINGAMALRMEKTLGSFEKNKKPGLVVISEMNHLQLTDASSAKRIL